MEENTLYDIINKIETIISDLSYFEESEALNVLVLQEQLRSIKKEIEKRDIHTGELIHKDRKVAVNFIIKKYMIDFYGNPS